VKPLCFGVIKDGMKVTCVVAQGKPVRITVGLERIAGEKARSLDYEIPGFLRKRKRVVTDGTVANG